MLSWIISLMLLVAGLDRNVDALVVASGLFAIAGNIASHGEAVKSAIKSLKEDKK